MKADKMARCASTNAYDQIEKQKKPPAKGAYHWLWGESKKKSLIGANGPGSWVSLNKQWFFLAFVNFFLS